MKWDEIENSWVAMTRRVRADWSADRADAKANLTLRAARFDVARDIIADQRTVKVVDAGLKMSTE